MHYILFLFYFQDYEVNVNIPLYPSEYYDDEKYDSVAYDTIPSDNNTRYYQEILRLYLLTLRFPSTF